MIVPFSFLHRNKQVAAQLVYNFKVIRDVMLIRLLENLNDLKDDVLFCKLDKLKWFEVTQLSVLFPDTFQRIVQHLTGFFHKEGFCFYPAERTAANSLC